MPCSQVRYVASPISTKHDVPCRADMSVFGRFALMPQPNASFHRVSSEASARWLLFQHLLISASCGPASTLIGSLSIALHARARRDGLHCSS